MRVISSFLSSRALALVLAVPVTAAPVTAHVGLIDPMQTQPVPPAAAKLANQTLDEMRGAPPELARTFGFASADEARQARLGTPLREYDVALDALRAYAPKTPPASIISGGTTFDFPVVAGDAIRSAIRIGAVPGAAPKLLAVGGAEVFARLQGLEKVASQLRTPGNASIPAIRVPALGLYFVGRRGAAAIEIASLFDVPQYGLKGGVYEDAGAVFTRLAPFARALRGGAMGR